MFNKRNILEKENNIIECTQKKATFDTHP